MNTIANFPYWEIQFTKEGLLFDNGASNQLLTELGDQNITDLFVVSHGWNNDMDDARALYRNLFSQVAKQLPAAHFSNRKFGVAGVLWPSKKFTDTELIPGGGAASIDTTNEEATQLLNQLENLKDFFDGDNANELLQKAKEAAKKLDGSAEAQENFVKYMDSLMQTSVHKATLQPQEEKAVSLTGTNSQQLLAELQDAGEEEASTNNEGAADIGTLGSTHDDGSAAGLGSFFDGVFKGAKNLLNLVTYYQMKERAGKVGTKGLHPLLVDIHKKYPQIKLHLIGHSFGARLVTAAIAGDESSEPLQVDTLTLLQAAFSHYSFSENYDREGHNGFFRSVIQGKVKGPVLISYTRNDKAVGLAYALASRIAKQIAAGLGDKNDIYGGLGSNGAQITPEADNTYNLDMTTNYNFIKGKVYNLNADACITGHSDICKEEAARAIFTAIAVE